MRSSLKYASFGILLPPSAFSTAYGAESIPGGCVAGSPGGNQGGLIPEGGDRSAYC